MKKILFITILTFMYSLSSIYAEENEMFYGILNINQKTIQKNDTVIYDNGLLCPLRTALEELGATVEWNPETNNTNIYYNGKKYICEITVPNDSFPDYKYIVIRDTQADKYLQLNPMGILGGYKIINDRTYLYQETSERLFKSLECSIEFDMDNYTINICGY